MKSEHDRNGRGATDPGTRQSCLELWLALARRNWASLAVIPADRDGSTAEVANLLAEIGQRLSFGPVTAITLKSLEYGSVLALADLQQHLGRDRRRRSTSTVVPAGSAGGDATPTPPPAEAAAPPTAAPEPRPDPADGSASEDPTPAANRQALLAVPPARLIISVPPVVSEPLGLAAVEAADAIVLAIRMNRSRMPEVRRTIQLVGRDRLAGCFLVR